MYYVIVNGKEVDLGYPASGFNRAYCVSMELPGLGMQSEPWQMKVEATAVPEPTTFAVLALGGLAVLGRRRR